MECCSGLRETLILRYGSIKGLNLPFSNFLKEFNEFNAKYCSQRSEIIGLSSAKSTTSSVRLSISSTIKSLCSGRITTCSVGGGTWEASTFCVSFLIAFWEWTLVSDLECLGAFFLDFLVFFWAFRAFYYASNSSIFFCSAIYPSSYSSGSRVREKSVS